MSNNICTDIAAPCRFPIIGKTGRKKFQELEFFLLALVVFFIPGLSRGQANEDFANLPTASASSYLSRSWTGTVGVVWTAEGARTDQTLNGKAITFGTSGNRWVTSPTIAGGMGVLTFKYDRAFTGTGGRSLEIYVNGVKQGATITVLATASQIVTNSTTVNVSGDVVLEIRSTGAGQVKVDDISWTAYSSSAPDISVSGNSATITSGDSSPSLTDHTIFADALVAGGTATRTFTINNPGSASLTLQNVAVGGANAGDFSVTTQPSLSIAAAGSSTFTVTFDPSSSGARNATLYITNDVSGKSPYTFSILGTGTFVEVAVSGNGNNIDDGDSSPSTTDHTDFGSVGIVGTNISRTYTITNAGNRAMTVGNVSIAGTHASDFTVTAQPAASVAAQGSTTFTVQFDPSATGTRSASLSFSTSDDSFSDSLTETTFNFEIQGTGGAAQMVADPATRSFVALVGLSPADKVFTLSNTGFGFLVYTISDDAAWLSVSPASGSLAEGASQVATVTVSSASLAAGSYSATITITDGNAGNSPQTIAVDLTMSEGAAIPSLGTASAANITAITADLGANIPNTNGATVTERGVYWSTVNGFTPPGQGTKVSESGSYGNGAFSVTATGLNPGTVHYFQAFAVNSEGTNYLAQSSFLTAPAAPGASAATSVSSSGFTANWTAATGATNYILDVAEDSGFSTYVSGYQNFVAGSATALAISGLNPATPYYYRVRAQNETGISSNSATITATTSAQAPVVTTAAISNLTESSVNSGGEVTSDGGASVTSRGVAYGTSANPTTSGSKTSDGTGTGAFNSSITGLTPGTVYYARAYAVNSAGTSYGSQIIFTTTCFSASVTGVRASATNDTSFTAAWDALSGATSYRVDVSTTAVLDPVAGGNSVVFAETLGSVAATTAITSHESANGFDNDSFTMSNGGATNSADIRSTSSSSGYTNEEGTAASGGANLFFTSSAGEYGFAIGGISITNSTAQLLSFGYRKESGSANATLAVQWSTNGSSWNSITVSNLPSAAAAAGWYYISNLAFNAGSTTTNLSIRWFKSGSVAMRLDDILLRSVAQDTPASFVSGYSNRTVSAATSVSVTGLTEDVTYYFRVRGVAGSCTSDNSTTASVTTVVLAANPPTVSSATNVKASSFFANWSAALNATGYELDVATDAAFTSFVSGYNDRSVGNVTTFAVTNLSPVTTYYYRLRSLRTGVESTNSGTQTVTTAVGAPTVGSPSFSSVATNSATLGGTVTATNGGAVLEYGVYWSTTNGFAAPNGSKVVDEGFISGGVFTVVPGNLPAGTEIYFQAFARNSGGTGFTAQASFTTQVAAVTADEESNIAPTSFSANWFATSGATNYFLDVATDSGFSSLLAGYDNLSVGNVLTYAVTGLTSDSTYYYRVRAQSAQGTGANSATITVLTGSVEPTVISFTASNITYTAATVGGEVTSTGGAAVTNRGVVYSTSPNPTLASTVQTSGTGLGAYTIELTGLTAGQTYYAKAFAQNINGTAFGDQVSFATTAPTAPSVTTDSASALSATTGEASGTVTSENGASVTNRGIVWSTTINPTIANSRTNLGAGATSFTGTISGLTAGQTYYARAFAQNSAGAGYGSSISFTADCFSAVVTGLNVTQTNNNDFTAAWSALDGATGYQLDVSTNSEFEASSALSATLVAYTFPSAASTPALEATTVDAAITASVFSVSSGTITTNQTSDTSFANRPYIFSDTGWNTTNWATAKKFQFIIYPLPGQTISITNISFDAEATSAGPSAFRVDIGSGAYAYSGNLGSATFVSVNETVTGVDNQTGPITVTIAGFTNGTRNTSGAGQFKIDSVQLNGTVSAAEASYVAGYSNRAVSGTSVSVTGLTDNVTYHFRVRATGGVDCVSGNSATQSVTTLQGVPAAPVIAAATNVASYSFDANWSAVGNAASYRLDVATDSGFTAYVSGYQNRNVGDVTTFAVTNLSVPVTYYYRVRAVNVTGTSVNSATQSVTTVASAPAVSLPTSASITVSSATLGATIDNTNGASVTEWGVYWSTLNSFSPPSQGTKVSDSGARGTGAFTVSATGLNAGSTIYFRGFAINSGGTNYTAQSSFLTVPAAPAVAAASSVLSSSFMANWIAASGATNYQLDVSSANDFSSYVSGYENRVAGNVTQLAVTNLTAGTTYYYRLRAQNASGISTNSANGSAMPVADVPVVSTEPVTDVTLTTAKSGGNVTDDGGSAVTNRGVVWGTSVNPTIALATKTSDGSGTGSFTNFISNLSPGQTYYARAYAQNSAGTGYGANESFTTECFPAGPASLAVIYTNSLSVTASWAAVSSATFYHLDVSENPNFGTEGLPATAVLHNGTVGEGTGGTWTETGIVQGSGYLQMLDSTDALITPAMNFNTTTVESLTFFARTFGGVSGNSGQITISVSTNNGSSYATLTTVTAASSTLTQMGPIDLSAYSGTQVKVRLQALSGTGSQGVGVDDVAVTNIGAFAFEFVDGYSNRTVSGTSSVVTGLTQNSTYYLRVRADGAGTCVSDYSPTATVTTVASEYEIYFTGTAASVTEHAGTANIPVALSISHGATVQVAVVGGTATEGVDYTVNNTNIVFSEGGVTTSNIIITVSDDTELESSETIDLQLVAVFGANLTTATNYTLTITDNEPSVSLGVISTSIVENVGTYDLVINKSAARNNVSGDIVWSGSAAFDTDYSVSASSFTLHGATTSATITITVSNDTLAEFSETIVATLTNISLASTGFPSFATITITDNNDGEVINPGDIAIIGFHSDDPDDFMIVALTNIPANTLITFTDNGVVGGSLLTTEATFSWITPESGISEGEVVVFTGGSTVSASTGTVSSGSFSGLSTSGDQILAYQGSSTAPSFIYGVNFDGAAIWQNPASGTSQSELPSGLVNGVTAVALSEADNGQYASSRTGDRTTLLSLIGDASNWSMNDTRGNVTFTTTTFTVTGPVPEIAVLGTNLVTISSGDTSPAASDGTDFGSIAVTATKDHVFTITNSGTASLTVSGVTISGAHAGDFSVQSGPAASVNAGDSTTFTVRFDPVTSGIRTALVEVANSDSDEGNYTFRIIGRATAPSVSFAYSSTNVEETAGTVLVDINLEYAADATVRVDVASGASATINSDFSLSATQFVFTAAGAISQTLTVTITDDSLNEETEAFTLRLVNHSNATNGSPSNVVFNILYNDAMPSLNHGDIAIIGRDYDADSFAIVALTNIAAGHIIYFTDSGWASSTDSFRANETLARLTINTEITAGTIITTTNSNAAWTWTTSGSAPVSGSLSKLLFTSSGDQIYAFQVPYPTNTAYLSDKVFIYVFDDTGAFENATDANTGDIPPGLDAGSNTAVTINFIGSPVAGLNMDNAETNGYDKAGWLAFINNAANWTTAASSLPGGTVFMGTPPAVLAAPALSAASTITTNSFRVNWTAVAGASSYRLDVSTANDFASFVAGYENRKVTGSNHTVTNLSATTTYYYRMRTANAGGISTNSATGTATTTSPDPVPDAPVAIQPTLISTNSFTAIWNAATYATSYRLDVATNSAFTHYVSGYSNRTVSGTSQAVTGLTAGGRYWYRVRAVNISGTSTNSNEIVLRLPDSDVVNVVDTGSGVLPPSQPGSAEMSFNSTEDVAYNVWYSDNDGLTWFLDTTTNGTGGQITVDVDEGAGDKRFFRVIPAGQNPTSSVSQVVAVVKPTAPQGYTLMSPPILSDRAFGGDFGAALAEGLNGNNNPTVADKVLVYNGGFTWREIYLDGSGTWREASTDAPSTLTLPAGQGFYLYSGAGANFRFTGEVGNKGTNSFEVTGNDWSIIGVSEGKDIAISNITFNGTPTAGTSPASGDRIVIDNGDGTFRTFVRLRFGSGNRWVDMTGSTNAAVIVPGQGAYYYRNNATTIDVQF